MLNAISKAREKSFFSHLERERGELRRHQSLLQELADLLAPYFEYLILIGDKKLHEKIIDENVCLLYEQGQDSEKILKEYEITRFFLIFQEIPMCVLLKNG